MMRVATMVLGVTMAGCLESDEFSRESLMVAAGQFAPGLVVAGRHPLSRCYSQVSSVVAVRNASRSSRQCAGVVLSGSIPV